MNVEQLLQLPELASIRLIGGTISARPIEKVTMMDAPDIMPYLQPNELIITTAYHLKQNDDYFVELIEAMALTGCAGIGIKLNRFLHAVPKAVIDAANRTSLPLILLPEALSLGEMSYRITEHILKSETLHLTAAIDVQRHLMTLLLKGHQIPRLVRELESMLSIRLHLLTPYLKPFTNAFHDVALTKQLTAQLCALDQTCFSDYTTRKSYMIFHIPTKYEQPFLLIAENLPLPLSNAHQFIFMQALNVLGFAILQHELTTHQQYAVANNALKEALDQPISPKQRTQYEQSWAIPKHFVCLYGKRIREDGLFPSQLPMQLQHLLIETLKESHIPMQVFIIDEEIVMLYPLKDMAVSYHDFLETLCNELHDDIQRFFKVDYTFGISNQTPNLHYLKRAYKEAKKASMSQEGGVVTFYKKKTFFELLEMIPNEDLRRYANATFKPLQHLSFEEQEVLLNTLEAFLETHCQISDTAKKLFIHRNTVLYRLNKCSTLLQKDLKDPEVTMQLRLALRIRKSFEANRVT